MEYVYNGIALGNVISEDDLKTHGLGIYINSMIFQPSGKTAPDGSPLGVLVCAAGSGGGSGNGGGIMLNDDPTLIQPDGVQAAGGADTAARADHAHPSSLTGLLRLFETGATTLAADGWDEADYNRVAQTIPVSGVTEEMLANVAVDDADWEKITQSGAKVVCAEGGVQVIVADEPAEDVGITYNVWEVTK